MKKGIELIAQERKEQIEKHGRTIENDSKSNKYHQLSEAAAFLCNHPQHVNYDADDIDEFTPFNWDVDLFNKMKSKSYEQRLIIAGALIAAELDRLNYNIGK